MEFWVTTTIIEINKKLDRFLILHHWRNNVKHKIMPLIYGFPNFLFFGLSFIYRLEEIKENMNKKKTQ